MKRSDVLNTINDLSRTGGLDSLGYELKLYRVIQPKIVRYMESNDTSNSGRYFLQGDATEFFDIDAHDKYITTSREFNTASEFEVISAEYDGDKDWTDIEILYSDYRAKSSDEGYQICLIIDMSNSTQLQNVGEIKHQMYEDNTFGNVSAGEFSFTLNDENKVYHNNVTKTGLFYIKEVLTEVTDVQPNSNYNYVSEMRSTWVRFKDLKNYKGSDFVHGSVEFITGKASGEKMLVLDSNHYNLKLDAILAPTKFDVPETPFNVVKGDKVRLYHSNEFYVTLSVWSRANISEKFNIFLGTIDLNTLDIDDQKRLITVKCFNRTKDLYAKRLSDLEFDTGTNLYRLPEVKILHGTGVSKRLRPVQRQEVASSNSIKVEEVAFDVSEGWHFIDFNPSGNLFRFDFGDWFSVLDEGSFEASTNSVFLPTRRNQTSPYDWMDYPAALPNHSANVTDNDTIERAWNGGWARITIATEEATFIGATNGSTTNNGNIGFKKLSNLPQQPTRFLFYVSEDRIISSQTNFQYSFDSGAFKEPVLAFDYIKVGGSYDYTYELNFGADNEITYNSDNEKPGSSGTDALDLYAYRKFNGVLLRYNNVPSSTYLPRGYTSMVSDFLQHTSFAFTSGDGTFTKSINLRYVGVKVRKVLTSNAFEFYIYPSESNLTLSIFQDLYDDLSGMRLMSLSGNNFLESKIIESSSYVSGSGTGPYTVQINIPDEFSDNVNQNDRFVIINKKFDIRFVDYGDSIKDGEMPDVLALYKTQNASEGYAFEDWYSLISDSSDYIHRELIRPGDSFYIGHRHRFEDFTFCLNRLEDENDEEAADTAWYIKEPKFLIEYYNGHSWSQVEESTYLPTSSIPTSDKASEVVKYKVNFSAKGWNVGGYVASGYPTEAPTQLDPDKIYMLRIKLLDGATSYLSHTYLSNNKEFSALITWDNTESWNASKVASLDGKIIADTFTREDLDITAFGLRVTNNQATQVIRQAQPINMYEGFTNEKYYVAFDWENIDLKYNQDVFNMGDRGQLTTIPKDISYLYLMKKIAEEASHPDNIDMRIHRDNFTDYKDNFANIMGSGYDGILPIDVGWDKAFTNENLADYFDRPAGNSYRQLACIRVDGTYWLYGVKDDFSNVYAYQSSDLKSWTGATALFTNVPANAKILNIEMVRNAEESSVTLYITCTPNQTTEAFAIWTTTMTDPDDTVDLGAVLGTASNKVIAFTGKHLGKATVAHLGGGKKIIAFEKFGSGNTSGAPTGNPAILQYQYNTSLSAWVYSSFVTGYGYRSPTFIRIDAAIKDSDYDGGIHRNYTLLMRSYLDDLYKAQLKFDGTADWTTVDLVQENIGIGDFCCICSSIVYDRGLDDREAHTICHPFEGVALMVGIGSDGDAWEGFVTDLNGNNFSSDEFFIDQTNIMNETDWFLTDSSNISLEQVDTSSYRRIYLGLRKPFNKILPNFISTDFTNRLQIRYWNGTEFTTIDRLYQSGRVETTSEFNPIFGFHYDTPTQWSRASFDSVSNSSDYDGTPMSIKSDNLYWVEIRVSPNYNDDPAKTISVKSFRNCYTNIFAFKGKEVYAMNNWEYFKQIYTIPYEKNHNYKIDSFAYDREAGLVLAILVDDNNYQYSNYEVYPFDVFGNMKESFKITDPDKYRIMEYRPDGYIRDGELVEYTIDGSPIVQRAAGVWDYDWWETKFNASAKDTPAGITGYNHPIPKPQIVRMINGRQEDWQFSHGAPFVNNIWMAARADHEDYPSGDDTYASLIKSFTNSGLLHEELVNGAYHKVQPGFYAFAERSYQRTVEQVHLSVEDEVSAEYTPGDTSDHIILVSASATGTWEENQNTIGKWIYADTEWQFSAPFRNMTILIEDANEVKYWNGFKWVTQVDEEVWPGRPEGSVRFLQIESKLDNESVRVPYYRSWNTRPSRFSSNNIQDETEEKMILSSRAIPLDLTDYSSVFGPGFDKPNGTSEIGIRPTCSAILPDASAIKDTPAPTGLTENGGVAARIMEPASPAYVFGAYQLKDWPYSGSIYSGSAIRYSSSVAYPYGISSINAMKLGGKIKNLRKAFFWNGSTYTDITNVCNYKLKGNSYTLSQSSDDAIYLNFGSSRAFAITTSIINAQTIGHIKLEYLNSGSVWTQLVYTSDRSEIPVDLTENDIWSYKTIGQSFSWNPNLGDWASKSVNSSNGYWIRITNTSITTDATFRWAVASGVMLWDSLTWWLDYTFGADYPVDDDDRRRYDTYVPMSIEYDRMNKCLIGSFWNYIPSVNKYYPFRIAFDKDELFLDGEYYWSWDNNATMEILDGETDVNYSYNIKSIASISNVDSKALLVDPANPSRSAIMANIKNVGMGEQMFQFGIG